MDEEKTLEELKSDLEELTKHNPAHCYGTKGFIPHSMTPELYQRIEDLEDRIKKLEEEA